MKATDETAQCDFCKLWYVPAGTTVLDNHRVCSWCKNDLARDGMRHNAVDPTGRKEIPRIYNRSESCPKTLGNIDQAV